MDDIFGDPDELLELYQRGKAARGGSRLEPVEEAPERLEDEDDDEADARQEAFSQRQARYTLPVLGSGPGLLGQFCRKSCQDKHKLPVLSREFKYRFGLDE